MNKTLETLTQEMENDRALIEELQAMGTNKTLHLPTKSNRNRYAVMVDGAFIGWICREAQDRWTVWSVDKALMATVSNNEQATARLREGG